MVSLARVVPADWTATARPTAPHTFGGRRLIASLSDDRVVIFSLDRRGRYTVGRDATADCNLHDLTVSRFHAAVTVEESITVEEVSSLNGVFVNDRRLGAGEKVVLAPGQVVRLGEVSITLVDVGVVSPSGREQAPLENGERAAPEQSGVIRVIRDPQMVKLHALARSVAAGNISVLLTGETGSGKEVFAEAIHRHSPRASKPFLSLNCAALSETLLESELFGYERGAFTGATQAKAGLLESADKGTIFLDEIGEMPAALQAKLLRVLEQRQVTRVGGLKAKAIDVRFISATNRDPEVEMERGAFRRDLFYRINGTMLFIPPLRERVSEIEPLARVFVDRASCQMGLKPPPEIAPEAVQRLLEHTWPGNIRELRNVMDRAVLLCRDGTITEADLAIAQRGPAAPTQPTRDWQPSNEAAPSHGEAEGDDDNEGAEQSRIMIALSRCGGNQTRAASLLGIARQTLIRRITEYRLPRPKRIVLPPAPPVPISVDGRK